MGFLSFRELLRRFFCVGAVSSSGMRELASFIGLELRELRRGHDGKAQDLVAEGYMEIGFVWVRNCRSGDADEKEGEPEKEEEEDEEEAEDVEDGEEGEVEGKVE
ncbi:MAG: hypothetical protein M1814_000784 [Vezdaea aestivalis]|nr:MAG: hypothetical protein M1814_000784 [Vezdaea aestivalis]